MDCIITGNSLYLPIGTKFSIKQKGFFKKPLSLTNGSEQNEFCAIFDENDVDFEICFDNRECDRGILVTLIVNEEQQPFYFGPKKYWSIKAMETNGRKLHLMSENTERGSDIVSQTANKYGISHELASIKCSKIGFNVEVEQCLNKVINRPLNHIDVTLIGNKIQVFVKTLTDKILTITIGANNTVNDLKMIIAKHVGIPSEEQRIIYREKLLANDEELAVCGVTNESNIELKLRLRGGQKPISGEIEDSSLSYNYNNTDYDSDDSYCSVSDTDSSYITLSDVETDDDSDDWSSFESDTTTVSRDCRGGVSQLFSGERGVICYGQASDQKFYTYNGFKKDCDIVVNSFVIEMRMESRYDQI